MRHRILWCLTIYQALDAELVYTSLIMNVSAVIPKVGIIDDTNIMIEDGKIKSLVNSANSISASRKIDARGKYVLPGAIDPHILWCLHSDQRCCRTESRSACQVVSPQ